VGRGFSKIVNAFAAHFQGNGPENSFILHLPEYRGAQLLKAQWPLSRGLGLLAQSQRRAGPRPMGLWPVARTVPSPVVFSFSIKPCEKKKPQARRSLAIHNRRARGPAKAMSIDTAPRRFANGDSQENVRQS